MNKTIQTLMLIIVIGSLTFTLWGVQDRAYDHGFREGYVRAQASLAVDILRSVSETGQIQIEDSQGNAVVLKIEADVSEIPSE